MLAAVITETLAIVVTILLLPAAFILLFLVHVSRPAILQKIGMGGRQLGLLMVGSTFGFFGTVPLLFYKGTFIMINVGGAIIPIVVSLQFLRLNIREETAKNLAMAVAGVATVAAVSYLVTTYDPKIGVYSEFPYYLAPIAAALLSSLPGATAAKIARLSYVSGTFGTLIGADLLRMPDILVANPTGRLAIGVIGGAGVLDMVYLTGILALCIVMPFIRGGSGLAESKRTLVHMQKDANLMIYRAERQFSERRYRECILTCNAAIKTTTNMHERFFASIMSPVSMGMDDHKKNDIMVVEHMAEQAKRGFVTRNDAMRCLYTTKGLVEILSRHISWFMGRPGKRIIAYIIDVVIVFACGALVTYLIYKTTPPTWVAPRDRLYYFAVLLSICTYTLHLIYFIVFEATLGKTPGKIVMGLRVLDENCEKCGLFSAFTRNVCRIVDEILLFYIISLYLISKTTYAQRVGDMIAGTIVIDESAFRKLMPTFGAFDQPAVAQHSTFTA